ncbi:sporulation protein [Novosphingobium sp. FGD1]|jgi:TPR repeat protein|uniref:Sporulation protein n=2 Tax=Novosphingobium silvae TaxID=2692619 RepID=A0A7X4GFC7_9SPHN|nr:SPOR domain-containing protein [Novosphingobium silvae]MYL97370.1 sporulation protein [Novosphingobium silvae]
MAVLGASVLAASPALADVKAGVDAWSAGDYAGAIAQWRPLAERGDPDAQFNLAQAYKLGRGVPADLGKAEDLYGKAAARGHAQAADSYGLLLFQRGERKSALPYLEASAARGDARAQYILGVAHFNGDIVAKDWVRAYALVSLAQQEGLAQATSAKAQMDRHIPLTDRQKSVPLAARIAGQAQANRQRLNTSAELGAPLAALEPVPKPGIAEGPGAPKPDAAAALAEGPAGAGADYTRSNAVPPAERAPAPAPRQSAAAKPERKTANTSPKAAPRVAAPSPGGPWRLQLGAFGVAGNAEALWARVRSRPELAGHSRALVPAGKLTKLQATGFASRADAQAACARLTSGGFGCLPVRD